MNAPFIDRSTLRRHVQVVEARFALTIQAVLPAGTAAQILEPDAVSFLAQAHDGLSLLGLAGAEIALGDALGRPVGIILASGLSEAERQYLIAAAEPL
jgi:hypothetical protein